MGIVALRGIEVYGRVGVTEDERKVGRKYHVDVELKASLKAAGLSDSIRDAPDYSLISEAVYKVMDQEFRLLEAAARAIAEEILKSIPGTEHLSIRIFKLSPLMRGNIHSAMVEWCYPEDY